MIKDLVISDMVFFLANITTIYFTLDAIEMSKSFFKIKGRNLFFWAEMF
jgi:hypothetical protein